MALNTRRMGMPRIDGLTLDGIPVEQRMLALSGAGVTIDKTSPTLSTETIPGRMGVLDVTLEDETGGAYMGMRDITLGLYAAGGEDDILQAKTWLGSLDGKTTSLRWRGLPGEYRGRLTVGAWQDVWTADRQSHALVEVGMTAMPCLYGPTRHAPLTAGINTVGIRGNRPAWPTWTLTPAQGAKSLSIRDAHGHTFTLNAAQTLSGQITVTTDPANRATRINGNLTTPTIDSDYFPLPPGANTLTLTGCSGRMAYEPLTLI